MKIDPQQPDVDAAPAYATHKTARGLGRLWPILILLLLPCCLLWPVLVGKCLVPADLLNDVAPWRSGNPADLAPWNPLRFDGIVQFYPWRLFAAETLKSGTIPLWNPHQFCGTPFLANSQSAVLYPLNLLFVIMPVAKAFGASAILHLFLTGVFLYGYMRRAFGVSQYAALLAGIVWQLSTWQVSWLSLSTFLDTSAWIPLALLLAHRLAQRPSAGRALALGGVLGLSLLAGHLQIGLYGILLSIAYAVYRSIAERVPMRVVVACGVLAGLMVFLTAAPQLLPVLELSRLSHRAASGHPTISSFAGYNRLAMPAFNLVTLLVPGFFGHPGSLGPKPGVGGYWGVTNYAENACYAGVAALMLALAGTVAAFRKSRPQSITATRFFVVAGLIALLLALGTPLGALLYFGVPGFGQSGSPARVLVVFTLGVAILAGVGVDALITRQVRARLVGGLFAGLVLLLGAVTIGLLNVQFPGALGNLAGESNEFRLFAGLAIASLAILALHRRATLSNTGASIAFLVLASLDLLSVNYGYNATVDQAKIYPVTPAIAWLQAHVRPGDRIMPINRDWSIVRPPIAVLPPNAATVYGFDDLQGYDSLQTGAYKAFASTLDGHDASPDANGNIIFVDKPFSKQSELAAARWIIASSPLQGAPAPVYADASCVIYEDVKARQTSVSFDCDRGRMHEGVLRDDSATRQSAYFQQPEWVTISGQRYPGWHVSVDGSETDWEDACSRSSSTLHGNCAAYDPNTLTALVGVAGSRLGLRFQPTSFRVGLYFGLIALALLAGFAAASYPASFLGTPPDAPDNSRTLLRARETHAS